MSMNVSMNPGVKSLNQVVVGKAASREEAAAKKKKVAIGVGVGVAVATAATLAVIYGVKKGKLPQVENLIDRVKNKLGIKKPVVITNSTSAKNAHIKEKNEKLYDKARAILEKDGLSTRDQATARKLRSRYADAWLYTPSAPADRATLIEQYKQATLDKKTSGALKAYVAAEAELAKASFGTEGYDKAFAKRNAIRDNLMRFFKQQGIDRSFDFTKMIAEASKAA